MAQGGIVPGVGGEQVAASVAKSRAGSISIPVDQLVKELYEFEDGFRAIVTRLKKSGGEGRIVGSQTFELHGARVRMEDTAIVDKGFRGEGIGPRQLEEVIRASKAEGVSTIGASESSLHESQRTAYTKAARETGAEVKMAKLGKEIEFDAKTKTYSPIGDYEGPILEVDLKNVKTDIERGFKSGFKKGTQEFLEKLQQRMAVVEGIRVHPSSGRAETLDQVAWEDAFASEGDPDAIARSPERAETAARIREAQAESTKALKARAAAPADAHLVAAELKEALAGNKANVAKAKARAPADADLLAEELREALAGNKDNAERSARIRAAQPAAGGQVVTDQLTTPPRQGREAFAGHPDEDMLDALADKIDDTGDIPGRGPKATAAGLRSAAEADQVARIIEQGEVIADIQGGPTAIQGERGAFFEAEGLTPESPEFEIRRAQEELRRTTAANEAQMEAEARARAEAKAAERTRRSRVDVDEYGQFTDESIPDEAYAKNGRSGRSRKTDPMGPA
jgi:L-amino acid N-acyltransferase YncA